MRNEAGTKGGQRSNEGVKTDGIQDFADQCRLKTRISSEDGTKIIPGRLGHIYEYNEYLLGVIVTPDPPRRRYWGCSRAILVGAGLTIVQDGDGEGAATFDPTDPHQSKAATRAAGIKQKRKLTPLQREQRITFLRTAQEGHIGSQARLDERAR